MNPKRIWLLLPTIILPYFALLLAATVFLSTYLQAFELVMERVFHENGLYILVVLLVFCLIAVVLSITFFLLSIRKNWNPVSLAKYAMVIKWMQVPAYIAILVFGLILAITLFTIPIAILFVLIDCLTLLLTGLLTISAAVNTMRQGIFQRKEILLIIILQFVFCLDVFATTVFYRKLRKHSHFDQDDRLTKRNDPECT